MNSESKKSAIKGCGSGSSHKGQKVKAYSLWLRMGITQDIRISGMGIKAACQWNNAPHRRLDQWHREYDCGAYAELPASLTQEEQLYETVSKMGASVHPKRTLNPEIEVVLVLIQQRGNNDSGMCVDECCRQLCNAPRQTPC